MQRVSGMDASSVYGETPNWQRPRGGFGGTRPNHHSRRLRRRQDDRRRVPRQCAEHPGSPGDASADRRRVGDADVGRLRPPGRRSHRRPDRARHRAGRAGGDPVGQPGRVAPGRPGDAVPTVASRCPSTRRARPNRWATSSATPRRACASWRTTSCWPRCSRSEERLPKLDRVVVFDDGDRLDDPFLLGFDELRAIGTARLQREPRTSRGSSRGHRPRAGGHARLHERHDRSAQGGDGDPRQHHVDHPECRLDAPTSARANASCRSSH